jgi:hypothetical protein
MDYILFMDVADCLDQLGWYISHCFQRKRIVVFYILEKRLKSSELCDYADFSQCLNTFKHSEYATVIKILHNIDLFADIFEFVRIFVHLEFFIHLNRKHIFRIFLLSLILTGNLLQLFLILLSLFDRLLLLFLFLRLIHFFLFILYTPFNQRLLFF